MGLSWLHSFYCWTDVHLRAQLNFELKHVPSFPKPHFKKNPLDINLTRKYLKVVHKQDYVCSKLSFDIHRKPEAKENGQFWSDNFKHAFLKSRNNICKTKHFWKNSIALKHVVNGFIHPFFFLLNFTNFRLYNYHFNLEIRMSNGFFKKF